MITYKELFEQLKNPNAAYPKNIVEADYMRAFKMLTILCGAEIAAFNPETRLFSLHPKQIERMAAKAAQNGANPANSEVSRMVHVDWSGRGHSSGKYKVIAETEKFVTIAFEFEADVSRKHTVSKARVKDAA